MLYHHTLGLNIYYQVHTQVRTTQRYAHLAHGTLRGAAGLVSKMTDAMAIPDFVNVA